MKKKLIALLSLTIFIIILTVSTAQVPPTSPSTPGQVQAPIGQSPIGQVPTIQHPDLIVVPEKTGDLNLGAKATELDKTNKEKLRMQMNMSLEECQKTMSKNDCVKLMKK